MGEHSPDHYIKTFQRVLDEECERLARIEKRQQALARGDHSFGLPLPLNAAAVAATSAKVQALGVHPKRIIRRQRTKKRQLVWAPDCTSKTKTRWSIPRRLSLEEKKALYKKRPDLDLLGLLERLENNFGRTLLATNRGASLQRSDGANACHGATPRDYLSEFVESEIKEEISRAQIIASTPSANRSFNANTVPMETDVDMTEEAKSSHAEARTSSTSTSVSSTAKEVETSSEEFFDCYTPAAKESAEAERADVRIEYDDEKQESKTEGKGKGFFWGNAAGKAKGKGRVGTMSPASYS